MCLKGGHWSLHGVERGVLTRCSDAAGDGGALLASPWLAVPLHEVDPALIELARNAWRERRSAQSSPELLEVDAGMDAYARAVGDGTECQCTTQIFVVDIAVMKTSTTGLCKLTGTPAAPKPCLCHGNVVPVSFRT